LGNPIYRWELMAAGGYKWWIERFRASLALFDLVRLDHFRGFESYWEVPPAKTPPSTDVGSKGRGGFSPRDAERFRRSANRGREPGCHHSASRETAATVWTSGHEPLAICLRQRSQGPSFRPHNYSRDLVAYTGGHDNDTTVGWWSSSGAGDSTRSPEDVRKEHEFASTYLNFNDDSEINWVMIRAVLASVADIAIVPLQDVLGLGSGARMNLPVRSAETGNGAIVREP